MIITWEERLIYFHSYPTAWNVWEETEPSDSRAIIRLFIQDNFCDFVNPVSMIKPLILPPSIILPFSWPHHKYWSPSSDVVIIPCHVASIILCGYLVTIPEARFSLLGNLPSPLISDVKLISVDTPSIGWTLITLTPVMFPLSSKSFSPKTIPETFWHARI